MADRHQDAAEQHGPALAESLRQLFPDLPVLFCSGYSEQLMSETGHLPAGATLLQKPYDARTLVAQVREMLEGAGLEGVRRLDFAGPNGSGILAGVKPGR